jgi:GxxExxY protein
MNTDHPHDPLTQRVIGSAFTVYNTLGYGFLEKVYENALVHELRKAGLHITQQKPFPVFYEIGRAHV